MSTVSKPKLLLMRKNIGVSNGNITDGNIVSNDNFIMKNCALGVLNLVRTWPVSGDQKHDFSGEQTVTW